MAPRKRKQFNIDAQIFYALEMLSRESGERLDALADDAFRGLLKRRGQPVTVEEALRRSVSAIPANDREPGSTSSKPVKGKSKRGR